MTVSYRTESFDAEVEHEGSKTPVKSYEWDEIEQINVDDPFQLKTVEDARRAHTFLHWGWDDRALDGWSYEQIIAEHARVVQYFIDQGERHVLTDSLDTTLPDNLKEHSKNPEHDLTSIRAVSDDVCERLHRAEIDTHLKLRKADAEELVEQTGLELDFVEYIQERAEEF